MFFKNRFPGQFLEGPSAELLESIVFVAAIFDFQDFQKGNLWATFSLKKKQKVPPTARAVLQATLLFTKP